MNGRENFACVAEGLAPHGWSVALPGFTLAPEANLEQIIAENRAALDWLQDHVTRYKLGGWLESVTVVLLQTRAWSSGEACCHKQFHRNLLSMLVRVITSIKQA